MKKILCLCVLLTGCATWSTSDIKSTNQLASSGKRTLPENIIITESDITDKPYTSISDLSVTVNKTTVFNADPTKEMVNEKLKEEAAKVGADAVINVRYGTVGISLMSWGSLDGKGRAVVFNH